MIDFNKYTVTEESSTYNTAYFAFFKWVRKGIKSPNDCASDWNFKRISQGDSSKVFIVINAISSLAKGNKGLTEQQWVCLLEFCSVEREFKVEWWKLGETSWESLMHIRPDLKEFITNNKDQYLLMREMENEL